MVFNLAIVVCSILEERKNPVGSANCLCHCLSVSTSADDGAWTDLNGDEPQGSSLFQSGRPHQHRDHAPIEARSWPTD
jgi:hypothetical protein